MTQNSTKMTKWMTTKTINKSAMKKIYPIPFPFTIEMKRNLYLWI